MVPFIGLWGYITEDEIEEAEWLTHLSTELGKTHQEVKVMMKVVQGEQGCEHQNSSCASSLQLWRVSSWLCVCRARCWLTDSPVYPKQQSRTLSWRFCNGVPASTITASTSQTNGLDCTFLYLLPCSTQSSGGYAVLIFVFHCLSV